MKITAEMLALTSREITEEELREFAEQTYKMLYLKTKAIESITCIVAGEDPVTIIMAELTIAILVGIKLGRKEAITELSQVR